MKKLYLFLSVLIVHLLMQSNLQAQFISQAVNFSATKDSQGGSSGLMTSGSYQIRYGADKTSATAQVTKPLILVEGWDPRHLDEHADIYEYLHPQLRVDLFNRNYDVITLNFDHPDFGIGFNGMLLVELIERLNSNLKSGNEEAVVLGMSMGGLVARFALKTMENLNIDHETRLYVSFDSPHQGATLPEGLYSMASHLATANFSILNNPLYYLRQGSPQLTELYHILTSSSVNQMLKNSSLHIPFQNAMDALGYPENLRKVAVSNGSMRGLRQRSTGAGGGRLNPGDVLISFNNANLFFGLSDVLTANFEIRSSSPGTKIADLDLDINIFNNTQIVDFDDYAYASDKPYEVNSGGYFELDAILGDVANGLPGLQNNMLDGFTFIPFASAFDIHPGFNHKLDIDLTKFNGGFPAYANNWDILCYSPFDNIIAAPFENEAHLEMTLRTANWLLDEIEETPTGTLVRNFCPVGLSLNDSDEPLCDNTMRTIRFVDLVPGHSISWTAGTGLDIVGSTTGNSVQVRNNPFVSGSTAVVTATITTAHDYVGPTVVSTTVVLGEPAPLQDISYDNGPQFPAEICLTTASTTLHFSAGVSDGADYYYWESDLPGFWGNISYGVATKFVNVNLPSGYVQQHYVRVKAVNSCGESSWTTKSFTLRYNPNGCSGSGEGPPGGHIPFGKNEDLSGFLSLEFEPVKIKLYDNTGRLIYSGNESYNELYKIDKTKVPDGHYFVHIFNKEGVIRKQILLNREK